MLELKIGKLPDRIPVKMTITLPPDLNRALRDYAKTYRATYGQAESVEDLIPFMLGAFLESDRGFAKARKDGVPELAEPLPEKSTRRRRNRDDSPSITGAED